MEDNEVKNVEGESTEESVVKNVEGESKSDKFKRLATKRVKNAISKVELIANLSGSGYEYTPEEVEKILNALQGSVDKVKAAFSKQKITKTEFEL